MVKQTEGIETIKRLKDWSRFKGSAERLAAILLQEDGFISLDPSHPQGGRDKTKDIICNKDDQEWLVAVYFSDDKKSFNSIKTKILDDYKGVKKHGVDGFVFFTNQKITVSEREKLEDEVDCEIAIYHLERVAALLNTAACFGTRLEFLDIEMTKEEQLSFYAALHNKFELTIEQIQEQSSRNLQGTAASPEYKLNMLRGFMPRKKYQRCKACKGRFEIVEPLAGDSILKGFASNTGIIKCPFCQSLEKLKSTRT